MANPRGMTLPSALIRPTAPLEPDAPDSIEADGVEANEGQGGASAESRAGAKPRRRRVVAPSEKTSKRGVYLTDSVWERLQYEAIRKRTNVSAILGDVLNRTLPRFKVEREA